MVGPFRQKQRGQIRAHKSQESNDQRGRPHSWSTARVQKSAELLMKTQIRRATGLLVDHLDVQRGVCAGEFRLRLHLRLDIKETSAKSPVELSGISG
jgi:hypothetical protein